VKIGPALPVVGVVGGIGSGKSLVAAELQRLGGYLIQGDQLGHEALLQPDIKERIVARFGKKILDEEGNVNRRALGKQVFAAPADLAALEEIVFPYIERRIVQEIEKASARPGCAFIVLDAAIMLETGWGRLCDRIIFVDAPRAVRLARLREQRGWQEEEVTRRERAQMSLEEKRRQASAVVSNAAAAEAVARKVRELLASWGFVV
jgi:dephospho-CoA kinase